MQNLHLAVTGDQPVDSELGLRPGKRGQILRARSLGGQSLGIPRHIIDGENDLPGAAELAGVFFLFRHQCAPR